MPYQQQQQGMLTNQSSAKFDELNYDAKLYALDNMNDLAFFRFCDQFDKDSICNSTKKLRDRRQRIYRWLSDLSENDYFKFFLQEYPHKRQDIIKIMIETQQGITMGNPRHVDCIGCLSYSSPNKQMSGRVALFKAYGTKLTLTINVLSRAANLAKHISDLIEVTGTKITKLIIYDEDFMLSRRLVNGTYKNHQTEYNVQWLENHWIQNVEEIVLANLCGNIPESFVKILEKIPLKKLTITWLPIDHPVHNYLLDEEIIYQTIDNLLPSVKKINAEQFVLSIAFRGFFDIVPENLFSSEFFLEEGIRNAQYVDGRKLNAVYDVVEN